MRVTDIGWDFDPASSAMRTAPARAKLRTWSFARACGAIRNAALPSAGCKEIPIPAAEARRDRGSCRGCRQSRERLPCDPYQCVAVAIIPAENASQPIPPQTLPAASEKVGKPKDAETKNESSIGSLPGPTAFAGMLSSTSDM